MTKKKRSKKLKDTNPHLKDDKKYRKDLIDNVVSSSSIEGIKVCREKLKDVKLTDE